MPKFCAKARNVLGHTAIFRPKAHASPPLQQGSALCSGTARLSDRRRMQARPQRAGWACARAHSRLWGHVSALPARKKRAARDAASGGASRRVASSANRQACKPPIKQSVRPSPDRSAREARIGKRGAQAPRVTMPQMERLVGCQGGPAGHGPLCMGRARHEAGSGVGGLALPAFFGHKISAGAVVSQSPAPRHMLSPIRSA